MNNKWLVLALVIVIYLPVSIDATVLHVAIPTLSTRLSSTASELLWIIDIYPLVMAGFLLPMGALGDRIGYRKLAVLGLFVFGIASLLAAFAFTSFMLIVMRALLALGAAMILPATLSAVRNTFVDERERAMALGIWSTVGVGGAAIGPLVGGYLLQYFYWGSVFLINVPLVVVAIVATLYILPKQEPNLAQQWNINKALVLIGGILLVIYAVKSVFKVDSSIGLNAIIGLVGVVILVVFIKRELSSHTPMIDFALLKQRELSIGIIMAITAMIAIVGFQLLMVQELQFVDGLTPLQAGVYMLPLMLASGLGGPLAGFLVNRFGLRLVASAGIGISAISFFGLAVTDSYTSPYWMWGQMVLLGLSAGTALLSATLAIMSSAPPEKASSAGAMEGIAYELGAGFGVVVFGVMLGAVFAHYMVVPAGLSEALSIQATASINEAFLAAGQLDNVVLSDALVGAAKDAFVEAHRWVLLCAGCLLVVLTGFVWRFLPAFVSKQEHAH